MQLLIFPWCCNWATEKQLFGHDWRRRFSDWREGGESGMYEETDSLTQLLGRAEERQLRAEARRWSPADLSRIKMIVSDWYIDEFGNQTRIVRGEWLEMKGRPEPQSSPYNFGGGQRTYQRRWLGGHHPWITLKSLLQFWRLSS
jgi:hypothetical protein